MKLAYADPPYPGRAHLYKDHPDYAGEVDHERLVNDLVANYDGWALSTSAGAPLQPTNGLHGEHTRKHSATTSPSTRQSKGQRDEV